MRYIVLNEKTSYKEMQSRKKYIEKVTNMYFIPYDIDGGIEFKSIPSTSIDCLFIVGHNFSVKYYLKNNIVPEKNIVIVSCGFVIDNAIKEGKTIYLSHTNEGKTEYYDGTEWNLNFNISKEELKIINLKGSFMEKVSKVFRRST